MTNWWPSKAIVSLLAEVNAAYPNRDKSADGIIGDARHQAEQSDHNPLPNGEVCAVDITTGEFSDWLASHLATLSMSGDKRIKYIIWDRRIFDLAVSPNWRTYTGADPHTSHIHLSVYPNSSASPSWGILKPITERGNQMLVLTKNDGTNDLRLVDQNSFQIHGVMGPKDTAVIRQAPASVVTLWAVTPTQYNDLVTQHGNP